MFLLLDHTEVKNVREIKFEKLGNDPHNNSQLINFFIFFCRKKKEGERKKTTEKREGKTNLTQCENMSIHHQLTKFTPR